MIDWPTLIVSVLGSVVLSVAVALWAWMDKQ